jgi:hypothetical protein
MKDFHCERVSTVLNAKVPLTERDGGILVLHLIPESCVVKRKTLDGPTLKEHGARIRPLGNHGGTTRFNVDGFLNQSGSREVRAYSQLFRDGRLESVMSDVGYPVHPHVENAPLAIRCGLVERAAFEVVGDYLTFCQATQFEPPLWLFSALLECKGFRILRGAFRDLIGGGIDRSPAFLPELEIPGFETDVQKLLRPWCDTFWQAAGLERSFNYDENGWHEPR